jgi:hypothetical protein
MIDPLSGNLAAFTQALAGAAPTAGGQTSVLANVADLLGMSTDDLATALRGGASMSDLVTQKGIPRDDLLAAINRGLQSSPNAAPGDTTALAARIADRRGAGGNDHRHGAGAPTTSLQESVAALAGSLGMSSDQLVEGLRTGLAGAGGTAGYGVSASLLQGLRIDQLA